MHRAATQTSHISFLVLEAADKINTSLNLTVRVHDGLDPQLFRKSVEYLVKTKTDGRDFPGTRPSWKTSCGTDTAQNWHAGASPWAATGCRFPDWNIR